MSRNAVWRTVLVLALLVASGCQRAGDGSVALAMAPESALPEFVRGAPTQVREAYRFAIANPDLLRAIPCYCGCGAMGHRSNLDCYIRKRAGAAGALEFEDHAVG